MLVRDPARRRRRDLAGRAATRSPRRTTWPPRSPPSGISIYAWHGMNVEEFYWCIDQTLEFKPTLTLDDGADLIFTVHTRHPELAADDHRRHRGDHHRRAPPARHGRRRQAAATRSSPSTTPRPSGTSTTSTAPASRRIDGILRATSVLLAGKNFVVAGYGHCGKRLRDARARAWAPTSSSPRSSRPRPSRPRSTASACMTMDEAAKVGDIFITATGMKDVIVEPPLRAR